MSLVGALTPLGKAAHRSWLRAVAAYTVAGCVSSAILGFLVGEIGWWFRARSATFLIVPFTLILAVRECGWISFKLPEIKRQTQKVWAHEFGFVTAAAMWGLDVGCGVTTYVTYSGFFVLAAI